MGKIRNKQKGFVYILKGYDKQNYNYIYKFGATKNTYVKRLNYYKKIHSIDFELFLLIPFNDIYKLENYFISEMYKLNNANIYSLAYFGKGCTEIFFGKNIEIEINNLLKNIWKI